MWIIQFAGMIALILFAWMAAVLYGFLPDNLFWKSAALIMAADAVCIAGLARGMGRRRSVPGGAFFARLMTVWYVWQFLLAALGTISLIVLFILRMAVGWTSGDFYFLYLSAFTLALSLYSVFIEPERVVTNRFVISVPNLPEELDGFTIAQISDPHVSAFFTVDKLRRLLHKAAAERPDMLAVTGDVFDNSDERENAAAARCLDEFTGAFPAGIFYCWGNHEYYHDIRAIDEALTRTRVTVLKNRAVEIKNMSRPLYILGVDYPVDQGVARIRDPGYLKETMKDVPENAVKILLAHHPDFFTEAKKAGIALTLSGHTHGGQLGLFGRPLTFPVFRYTRGLYREDGCTLYVHRGNGGRFPFRLGCAPEIACFTLRVK